MIALAFEGPVYTNAMRMLFAKGIAKLLVHEVSELRPHSCDDQVFFGSASERL